MKLPVRLALVLGAIVGGSLATGCLSRSFPDRQRFHLVVDRPGPPQQSCDCSARIERVRVAQLFEGRSFVYKTDADTAQQDFYNQFFAAPGSLIREETKNWLTASGIFSRLLPATVAVRADWLIEGRVSNLYVDLSHETPRAIMEIQWAMLDGGSRELEVVFDRTYGASRELPDRSARAAAEAWRQSLFEILTLFETDLREFFAARAEASAATNATP